MTTECEYGLCKHDDKDHKNGNCYAVTQPEKEGIEQFCKCGSQDGHNLRLYQDLGYIVPDPNTMMTIKRCQKCRGEFLLRIDDKFCMDCKPTNEPKFTEVPEFMIFRPLSQEELQIIL